MDAPRSGIRKHLPNLIVWGGVLILGLLALLDWRGRPYAASLFSSLGLGNLLFILPLILLALIFFYGDKSSDSTWKRGARAIVFIVTAMAWLIGLAYFKK